MRLDDLLHEAGIQSVLAGSHENDLYLVNTSIDGLVVAYDGWPLVLRQLQEDGTVVPIIFGTPDDGTLQIDTAEYENMAGTRRIVLVCRLGDFTIPLTVEKVRSTIVLDDDPVMVHPMMHRRSGIVSRFWPRLKRA